MCLYKGAGKKAKIALEDMPCRKIMHIDKIDEMGKAWVRSFHFPYRSFCVGDDVMVPERKRDLEYLNNREELGDGVIHAYTSVSHLLAIKPSSVKANDIVIVRCHIPKGAYYWTAEIGGLCASTELVLDYLAIVDLQLPQ